MKRPIVLLACLALCASALHAQNYPAKPVRIISPYPPGGLGDTIPRAIAIGLTELLGQQVIVDNRPGASQIIGMQLAAKSPPDGYTLMFGAAGLAEAKSRKGRVLAVTSAKRSHAAPDVPTVPKWRNVITAAKIVVE